MLTRIYKLAPSLITAPFQPEHENRLSKKIESKVVIEQVEILKKKCNSLKNSADHMGSDSVDYAKHIILNNLLKKIDISIHNFNAKETVSDEVEEILLFINFLREINQHLSLTLSNPNYYDTLNSARNDYRENAQTALAYGYVGFVGTAFLFSSLIAGAAAYFISEGVHKAVRENTDLFRTETDSVFLIRSFQQRLENTIKNLILNLNFKQLKNDNVKLSNEDNMICPITRQLIEDPVVCILDGYSYERSAIIKWLTSHRTSPMTRKMMPADAQIQNVIIDNRNLKEIIKNYQLRAETGISALPPEDKQESESVGNDTIGEAIENSPPRPS